MSSNVRSLVSASLLGAGLATVVLLAACRSIEVTTPGGGIKIEGDDGVTITAVGLEAALQKAMQAKKDAEARGDKAGAADWGKIIERIIDKKGGVIDQKALLAEGEETGTVTVSTNEEGETVYSWVGDGVVGAGTAGL